MEHKHLDFDAALQASYGVFEDRAWRGCPVCREAIESIDRRRAQQQGDVAAPEWFWQRQRRAVLEVAAKPLRSRWISVAALAGVLTVAVLAIQPRPSKGPVASNSPGISSEDEQLFEAASATITRVQPRALAPMDVLWAQP